MITYRESGLACVAAYRDRGNATLSLPHLHDETLQIPRLWHTSQDGMVGAVASLFDESDVSFGIACGKANALPQVFL